MAVVLVAGDPYGRAGEFAAALAARLGYRGIEPAALIERAAAWGVRHRLLRAAAERPPGLLSRLLHSRRAALLALQAAAAQEILPGNAVCYGPAAWLLPAVEGVIRVRLIESPEARALRTAARFRCAAGEAGKWIRRADRRSSRWVRGLRGTLAEAGLRDEISLDLDALGLPAACEVVAHIVGLRSRAVPACRHTAALRDLAARTRLQAALALDRATAHLELEAGSHEGIVTLRGRVRGLDDLEHIRRVAAGLPEVRGVELEQLRISTDELAPRPRIDLSRRPRPALGPLALRRLAWAGGALLLLTAVLVWLRHPQTLLTTPRGGENVRVIAGVITDTHCGASHAGPLAARPAECVRRCVAARPGVSYALYDGERLYPLRDDGALARFAGLPVTVTGVLDSATGRLSVSRIRERSLP